MLCIVANKSDLGDWVVPRNEVEAMAQTLNATLFETSAKKNTGINELFADIIRYIMAKVPTETPSTQNNVPLANREERTSGGSDCNC